MGNSADQQAELLELAKQEEKRAPLQRRSHSRYDGLRPTIEELRAKNFSWKAISDWLAEKGVEGTKPSAVYAFYARKRGARKKG